MSNLSNTPIIGIDRGASFTDLAVIKSGRLVETFSVEKRDWKSIGRAFDRLSDRYQTNHIVFTSSQITPSPVFWNNISFTKLATDTKRALNVAILDSAGNQVSLGGAVGGNTTNRVVSLTDATAVAVSQSSRPE